MTSAAGLLLLSLAAPAVQGPPGPSATAIETTVDAPVAVRGGVLMVPLAGTTTRWPETLELRLEDGRRVTGTVAWIVNVRPQGEPGWSDDPRRIEVRSSVAEPTRAAPYLLAELPADGTGAIRLGRQTMRPIWVDEPLLPIGDVDMVRETRPDRPDAVSPFEHWRWVLLAEATGRVPPSTDALGGPAALLARHYSGLWRVGLARLAAHDPATAARCRAWMTAVASDEGVNFGVWIADPRQTSELLTMLVDPTLRPARLAERVMVWLDTREPVLMWLEADAGPAVRLAMVNRTPHALVARFRWMETEDIPIAVEIPARTLIRAVVDRPPPPEPRPGRLMPPAPDTPSVLDISVEGRRFQLPVASGVTPARPPGAYLPPLRASLTLAEVESRQRRPIAADRAAAAHVRLRDGRWELFVECRRPADDAGADRLTVMFGAEDDGGDAPRVTLRVPEDGAYTIESGPPASLLEVHRRSWADRWYCRIVLPPSWIDRTTYPPRLVVGCVRHLGDAAGFQVTPGRSVPWRPIVGRMVVELGEW